MDVGQFDQRPIIVAIAGPNGAGKTTFYHSYLAAAGLRFVNADVLSRELALGPYEAASMADRLRRELLKARESFVFETVFLMAQAVVVRLSGFFLVALPVAQKRPADTEDWAA